MSTSRLVHSKINDLRKVTASADLYCSNARNDKRARGPVCRSAL